MGRMPNTNQTFISNGYCQEEAILVVISEVEVAVAVAGEFDEEGQVVVVPVVVK